MVLEMKIIVILNIVVDASPFAFGRTTNQCC
jgi:hypothetical protein